MGLTQSKLAVGDLVFDARLSGPADGAVVVLLHGWPEFSSWWHSRISGRRFRPAWLFL
jgi:pimeloyl-ACP methyl ester carboxylesterase